MEKAVQALILKHSKIIKSAASKYVRRNPRLQFDDLFQEGLLSCLFHWKRFSDINDPKLGLKIWQTATSGMREYLRKFMGVKMSKKDGGRLVRDMIPVDFTDEAQRASFEDSCEQPSLEEKDLIEKVHKEALKILTGKQYMAVYSNTDNMTWEEKNRRGALLKSSTEKLKTHIESLKW